MLVGLTRVNDISLVDDPKVMSREVCLDGDIPLIRRMSTITNELYTTFNYEKSPEFLRSVTGKSELVRAMRLKFLTPQRRAEMHKRFGDALVRVMESDDILDLVESSRHERIKELRGLLLEVSNPTDS
jgi:hypothetical protein